MDSNRTTASVIRGWLPAVAVALLAAQVALLWLQGVLLNRQRTELASLRSEIVELTVAINESMFIEDEPYAMPITSRPTEACPHCGRSRVNGAQAYRGK